MRNRATPIARSLVAALLFCVVAHGAAQDFSAQPLRGFGPVNVAVDGVEPDYARYGLSADALRRHVEAGLTAAGFTVVDDAVASRDAGVGQLRVKLRAVLSAYGFYSYALALEARRKLPLAAGSFVSQSVWSTGQSGVLTSSELPRLIGVSDTLLAAFTAAHGADNVGAPTP
ncbi:MAG: hypothetical protein AB7I01_02860 [Gammaproteobacteria bacterium]